MLFSKLAATALLFIGLSAAEAQYSGGDMKNLRTGGDSHAPTGNANFAKPNSPPAEGFMPGNAGDSKADGGHSPSGNDRGEGYKWAGGASRSDGPKWKDAGGVPRGRGGF